MWLLVQVVKEWNANDKMAGGPQDPCQLVEQLVRFRDMLKNIGEDNSVEAVRFEGEPLIEINFMI